MLRLTDTVDEKGKRKGRVLVRLERAHAEYDGPLHVPDNAAADVQGVRIGIVLAASPRCADLAGGARVLLDQIATIGAWPRGPVPDSYFVPEHQVLGLYEDEDD